MKLNVNDVVHDVPDDAVDARMPLLWALRDVLGLTGTKYGCGVAACGACTVHVQGRAVRSCVTPVSAVLGQPVRTIEGLGAPGRPHALQTTWISHQVPQRHRFVIAASISASLGLRFAASSAAAAMSKPLWQ